MEPENHPMYGVLMEFHSIVDTRRNAVLITSGHVGEQLCVNMRFYSLLNHDRGKIVANFTLGDVTAMLHITDVRMIYEFDLRDPSSLPQLFEAMLREGLLKPGAVFPGTKVG